jgi:uncharacterized cysteine cluster protein YcgN (CxxCxxCC family)
LADDTAPFWKTKTLDQMSTAEWESLCDGCARCCLVKLEDEDSGKIHLTRLACRLLDTNACRCTDYSNRFARMSDCLAITPANLASLTWLPETCGYRTIQEGRDLAWWHPLVSGDPDTVHLAGISARGWTISEARVPEDEIDRYIIQNYRKSKAVPKRSGTGRTKRRVASIPGGAS